MGYDQRKGAQHLGIHFTTLNKLVSGKRLPGRQLAIDLQEKTGVPVVAWKPLEVGRRRRTDRKNGKNSPDWQAVNV